MQHNLQHNYTVQETQSGDVVLLRDNKALHCPFQPAIPTQSQMGGLQLIKQECNSQCPHFNFDIINLTDGETIEVELTCGSGVKFICSEFIKHQPINILHNAI